GTLFTRAYCPAPSCNPSRVAVLTGVRPSTSGIYDNDQPWRDVLKDAVTLPRYFLDQGYNAQGCGKVFHTAYNDPASWQKYLPEFKNPVPPRRLNGLKGTGPFDWGPLDVGDE